MKNKVKKMKSYISLLIITSLLFSCSTPPQSTKATIQDISESVYASGNIESADQYQVYSTVSGIIENILVYYNNLQWIIFHMAIHLYVSLSALFVIFN